LGLLGLEEEEGAERWDEEEFQELFHVFCFLELKVGRSGFFWFWEWGIVSAVRREFWEAMLNGILPAKVQLMPDPYFEEI
jgi:hypothetical protein